MNYKCFNEIISFSGENNFIVDDGHLNETFDDFWDNQEQIFNGLQENNPNNDTNIVEKRLRLIQLCFIFV